MSVAGPTSSTASERPLFRYSKRHLVPLVAFAVICAAMIVGLVLHNARHEKAMAALAEQGRHADATVIGVEHNGADGTIRFRFTAPGGQAVEGTKKGRWEALPQIPTGGTVGVTYDPADPQSAVLGDPPSAATLAKEHDEFRWIVVIGTVVVGVLTFGFFNASRTQLAFARRGATVTGQVVGKFRAGATGEGVEYVFQTADGQEVRGRSRVPAYRMRSVMAQPSCIVVYRPDQPTQSALLASLYAVRKVS